MPHEQNDHIVARAGTELRAFGYTKAATVAVLPATGQPGEIVTVTATGVDYQWNQVLGAWVPWHNAGSVLRQNITGAATVDVTGRSAVEATLTGNVTSLAISGWDTDTTITQRVRVQVVQDVTGGRGFAWQSVNGIWLESPPTTLDTLPGVSSLQFYAITTNGGATVWLEPIGIGYQNDCVTMQVAEVDIPAVPANGSVVVSHDYSILFGVELVNTSTHQRALADWAQLSASPGAPAEIFFTGAHAAGTWKARIAGLASAPCALTAATSDWVSYPLALNAATSVSVRVDYTGAAGAVEIAWGDGSSTTVVSAATNNHTYGSAFTGSATLRVRRGATVTQFTSTVGRWSFALSALPPTLTTLSVTGAGSAVTGSLSSLPVPLTFFQVTGSNSISGYIDSLPSALTYFELQGSNSTSGSVANLPTTLTTYHNQGSNTTTGDVAALPAGLVNYVNFGLNTTFGLVSALPAGLVSFDNGGSNTTSGSIGALPAGLVNYNNQGANATSGVIAALPATLTTYINTGSNTTSGSVATLPAGLLTYNNQGANTTDGSIASLPAGLVTYINYGSNTTSGSVGALPATLTVFVNAGANTTSGTLASLSFALTTYANQGSNTVALGAGYSPPAGLLQFHELPASGSGLSAADVDAVLAAIDALGTSDGGGAVPDVDLRGFNAAPTASGLTSKANLTGRGWTVQTN